MDTGETAAVAPGLGVQEVLPSLHPHFENNAPMLTRWSKNAAHSVIVLADAQAGNLVSEDVLVESVITGCRYLHIVCSIASQSHIKLGDVYLSNSEYRV